MKKVILTLLASFALPSAVNAEIEGDEIISVTLWGNPEIQQCISNDIILVAEKAYREAWASGHNIRLFQDTYVYYPDYTYNGWWEFSLFNCWSVSDHDCDFYCCYY